MAGLLVSWLDIFIQLLVYSLCSDHASKNPCPLSVSKRIIWLNAITIVNSGLRAMSNCHRWEAKRTPVTEWMTLKLYLNCSCGQLFRRFIRIRYRLLRLCYTLYTSCMRLSFSLPIVLNTPSIWRTNSKTQTSWHPWIPIGLNHGLTITSILGFKIYWNQ